MWEALTGDGYGKHLDRIGSVQAQEGMLSDLPVRYTTTLTFFLRQELFITFSKYGVDRLGRASVETEPATFHTARRVKFEGWG
jgi:hypothetical protein